MNRVDYRVGRIAGRVVGLLCVATGSFVCASPFNAVFDINPASSSLTVQATAIGFSDSDTQSLDGTINATFDFGVGGFGSTAEVTITSATVAPVADYNLALGFPPIFGVAITASDLVATVTTTSPPAVMNRTAAPGAQFTVSASRFPILVNQGTVVASGSVNQTINLADNPVSGTSPVASTATVTFTTGATSGPYTLLNATLNLPVDVTDTFTTDGGVEVDLHLTATVVAQATFYAALNGVPGDFDDDSDVDGADLTFWKAGYGTTGSADPEDGDADADNDADGADFLVWQRNLGIAPPAVPATSTAASVPEPGAAALSAAAIVTMLAVRRRKT